MSLLERTGRRMIQQLVTHNGLGVLVLRLPRQKAMRGIKLWSAYGNHKEQTTARWACLHHALRQTTEVCQWCLDATLDVELAIRSRALQAG